MKLRIFRYDADSKNTGTSEYDVPFEPENGCTLMTMLRYVHENLDPTLSFFSHCVCARGICGRCVVRVNGKPQLACAFVPQEDDLMIEPMNTKYFKDLVVN